MIEFKYSHPGGLPDGLTLENIKLRRIFKDYIGFDKQPEYSISDNGIIVTLYNMNYNEKENVGINEAQNDGINIDNVGQNVGQKINVNDRKNIILKNIKETESLDTTDIAKKLNVTKRTIERDLAELRKDNKIEYIGSSKNGKWIIKE